MPSMTLQVLLHQIHCAQLAKVFSPQTGKFIQQLPERLSLALSYLRETVEGLECLRVAELQQHLRPRHPVGSFAVNQVADHIERAPCIVPFILECPRLRQIAQKRIESSGSASEQRYCLLQVMLRHCPQFPSGDFPETRMRLCCSHSLTASSDECPVANSGGITSLNILFDS